MMKRIVVLMLSLFLTIVSLVAQDVFVESGLYKDISLETFCEQLGWGSDQSSEIPVNAALLATASKDYPVTPGDIYELFFTEPSTNGLGKVVSTSIQVDADNTVVVPFVGVLDATGMTFLEFKKQVISELNSYYSYLKPQLTIRSCGIFQVFISGEVKYATEVNAWGLARLSDICGIATNYASTRKVFIDYPDGSTKSYDLFNAFRNGVEEDNPYLVPNCRIRFVPAENTVFINGSVKRPGQYQIVGNMDIATIIEEYAGGFNFDAQKGFVSVSTFGEGNHESRIVESSEFANFSLNDIDAIYVSELSESSSYVTVQGAVNSGTEGEGTESGNFKYKFVQGEDVFQLLRSIKSSILENGDLTGIYLLRGVERISIDAEKAFLTSENSDLLLMQGDVIVIPFKHSYITVSGGVAKPGNYKYEPGKPASHYINLAGGFTVDAKKNTLKTLDASGNIIKNNSVVPNSTITVSRRNTNLAAQISVGISLATFALALYQAFN